MKNNLSKKIAGVLIITVLCTSVMAPKTTRAVWGFGDIALDPVQDASGIAQTIGQVTEIVNLVQGILKEFGLDVVIYKLAQQASQKLIAKVLNHQTGGAGWDIEYNFVENFQRHFQNINDQEFAKFTNYLASDTSNPYSRYIAQAMVDVKSNEGNPLSAFSLDKIDGVDWQEASTNIGSAGNSGWDFYSQLALPVNTPIGSSMIAQDQLASQISSKVETSKIELTSSGFKPDKGGCTSSPDKYDGSTDNPLAENPDCSSASPSADIKSPGSINEGQSAQATQEAFERLRDSDEIGKILFNTISQLATGLIKKGFSSLNSDGAATPTIYGGPQDLAKIVNSQNGSWSSAPEQVVDLRNDLENAITKTKLEIDFLNETINATKTPVTDGDSTANPPKLPTVLALEACIPGPDTGWETRLQEYVTGQLKETQQAGGMNDNNKAARNSAALTIITRSSKQSAEEERLILSQAYLNIPGAPEMKSALREYYKLSVAFRGLVDKVIIKQQVLNNLTTLRALITTADSKANGTTPKPPLVLFNSQWDAMTQAQKNTLYATLTPKIHDTFPEYSDPTDPNNKNKLKPLPLIGIDNPSTPENEASVDARDAEMKKRIFDQQWDEWETKVPAEGSNGKNQIYATYVGVANDISDSSTVERAKVTANSAKLQIEELQSILKDCYTLRNWSLNPVGTPVLLTERLKGVTANPSILNAPQSEFDRAEKRIIEEEQLPSTLVGVGMDANDTNIMQFPIPRTAAALLDQDTKQQAFCRLTRYHLLYWTPQNLTGKPIACGPILGTTPKDHVRDPLLDGGGAFPSKKANANWYHTNAAEILFKISDAE